MARPAQAEGAPGADRGWRLALARAARDAMGLDLEFRSLTIARRSLAEILEIVPDRALLALLDGPQGGLGVLMLGATVTASFIEKQTLGKLGSQAPAPRKASRIDAAMVAGVIDRALAGLDEALVEEAARTSMSVLSTRIWNLPSWGRRFSAMFMPPCTLRAETSARERERGRRHISVMTPSIRWRMWSASSSGSTWISEARRRTASVMMARTRRTTASFATYFSREMAPTFTFSTSEPSEAESCVT